MAEEKKAVAEQEKKAPAKQADTKGNKFVAWCKRLPSRIATPFKNMWYELKKVTWPTWAKLQSSALLVMVATVIIAIALFLIDFIFQHLMTAIYTL